MLCFEKGWKISGFFAFISYQLILSFVFSGKVLCDSVMSSEEQETTYSICKRCRLDQASALAGVSIRARRKTYIWIWWSAVPMLVPISPSAQATVLDLLHPENWACRKRAQIHPQNPQCGSKNSRLWLSHCMRDLSKGVLFGMRGRSPFA